MRAEYFETKNKNHCCGCSACAQKCPKQCIIMKNDEEGFLYPDIDKDKCIDCGICRKACPLCNSVFSRPDFHVQMYGGYIKDELIRSASSSGGMFTAISQTIEDKNAIFVGAIFKNDYRVYHEHFSIDGLEQIRGTKYLQSDINGQYQVAKDHLDKGKSVLFSGTACQIAGLYSFLGKDYDNLITIEIICHSVPSPIFFEKEKGYIERKNKSKIKKIVFRDKENKTWDRYKMSWYLENGKKIKYLRDPFFTAWNTGWMSRPSCYQCKYATRKRVADLTIGDLWGCNSYAPKLYGQNNGSSLCLVNTHKGAELFEKAKKSLVYEELEYELVARNNPRLTRPMEVNNKREWFMDYLINHSYEDIIKELPKQKRLKIIILDLLPRSLKDSISKKLSRT